MITFKKFDFLAEVFQGNFDNFRNYVNENNITILNLLFRVKNCNLKLLGEALKGTPVTNVDLGFNKISNEGAKAFGETLKDTQVTYVDFGGNCIGDQGASDFGDALKGTKVTYVNLGGNRIGDQGAKDFGQALQDTQVTYVGLSGNKIGDLGAKDFVEALFAEALKDVAQITHVDLSSNEISDQGAKALGKALKYTHLTHVNLNLNKIGNQGAKDFVEGSKGTQVTYVGLSCNDITHGLEGLGEALKGTPITHIDIKGKSIIDYQGAKVFASCIPDTFLLGVNIEKELEPYISEAVKSNIAKYIYNPYYLTALSLLPEHERNKFTDLKVEALETKEGQLQYACGILMRLPSDILNIVYRFLPLASKKIGALEYLKVAKEHHPNGLFIESNTQTLTDLQSAFTNLSLDPAPYQPEEDLKYKCILNQYHPQSEKRTSSSEQSTPKQVKNPQRKTLL